VREARISVVIPTFDRAPVLRRALDSVLGQSLPPSEVIVVDDASEDDTAAVVGAYGDAIRYVALPVRSGAQTARNRGIREARCEWIAFQDSDDEWLPDKLERQVALLAERDFDRWTVVHGQAVVREAGEDPQRFPLPSIGEADPLDVLLRGPATLFPALLVSTAALEEIGGLDEETPTYHEWETSIRLARVCRFVEPEEPVLVYHRTADAISGSAVGDLRGYQYVIDKFRDDIVERGGAEAWNAHIPNQLRRSLEYGLWDETDRLLQLVQRHGARYRMYAVCRRLRLRPRYVQRVRRLLGFGTARPATTS
jgi:glycosyltransferase involved in cell wall biosynthesis